MLVLPRMHSAPHPRGARPPPSARPSFSTYALDAERHRRGRRARRLRRCSAARRIALLLGFLALTYIAWGAGLRTSLGANWTLLEQTGTSTNALSKAAHDLAAVRGR